VWPSIRLYRQQAVLEAINKIVQLFIGEVPYVTYTESRILNSPETFPHLDPVLAFKPAT
jgi:hypothetical protein